MSLIFCHSAGHLAAMQVFVLQKLLLFFYLKSCFKNCCRWLTVHTSSYVSFGTEILVQGCKQLRHNIKVGSSNDLGCLWTDGVGGIEILCSGQLVGSLTWVVLMC